MDKKEMIQKAWDEWHKDLPDGLMPGEPNASFVRGFEAASKYRLDTCEILAGAFYRLEKYKYIAAGIYHGGYSEEEEREGQHYREIGLRAMKELQALRGKNE